MSSFRKIIRSPGQYLSFLRDYRLFKRMSKERPTRFSMQWKDAFPVIDEKVPAFGFDRHYIYHTAWAARVLAKTRPGKHIDISSCLYFNAIASAFIPFEFYEFRPADLHLDNFEAKHADILHLPFEDNSVESISSMHVIEHVGLGRYGDPIDPDGDRKAMQELQRVTAPHGTIIIVVPMGAGKIQFNAHRMYRYDQVVGCFSSIRLEEFAFIPDKVSDGPMQYNPPLDAIRKNPEGCGCFWFKKS